MHNKKLCNNINKEPVREVDLSQVKILMYLPQGEKI